MSGIFAVAGVQHGMKFTFPRNMIQWQNVVSTKPNLIKRGLGAELRHGCTEMAA